MRKLFLCSILLLSALTFSEETEAGMEGLSARKEKIEYYLNENQYIGETAKAEQVYTEISQRNLLKKQPPVILDWSLERDNLNRRVQLWNDPNKLSYIYLFNRDNIVGFFPIKGKVSSVNSQITNTNYNYGGTTVDSPSTDGSYGTNGDAVFFFLVDGTYMEWNGTYLLVDKPIKLNVEPMLQEK